MRLPRWFIPYGLALAVYAWVWAAMPVVALPAAVVDDALFVRHARLILSGQWLGEYTQVTLAKGPGFPIWLALMAGLGIPALLAQAMFYAGAALLVVRGLSRWITSEFTLFALWLLLLLNPALYDTGTLRILREGVYTPTLLLILGLVLWWVRWLPERPGRRALLAAGLGLALGFFHLTREESIWIAPFLLGCLLLRAAALWRDGGWRAEGVALLACLAAALTPVLAVSAMNARAYGFFGTVEFRDRAFLSAYASLARVAPDEASLIVLPRALWPEVFAASPAAAELRDYFETDRGRDYQEAGCAVYGIAPCDGEFRAGWFMWALRDATFKAGPYTRPASIQEFHARLSAELDAACAVGTLRCQPKTAGLAPRFRPEYLAPTLDAARRLIALSWRAPEGPRLPDLRSIYFPPNPFSEQAAPFLEFVQTPLYLDPTQAGQPAPEYLRFSLLARRGHAVLQAMDFWGRAWSWVALPLHLAGLLAMLALPLLWRRRPAAARWLPWCLCCGAYGLFLTRVALLAYLDAVAIPSAIILYLSPAIPCLLLAGGVALALLAQGLWPETSLE